MRPGLPDFFFFSSRRRHTRCGRDWSSDVCSSDLPVWDGATRVPRTARLGFVQTRAELDAVPAWRRPKLVGVFSKEDLAFVNQVEERSQQPSLSDMVRRDRKSVV